MLKIELGNAVLHAFIRQTHLGQGKCCFLVQSFQLCRSVTNPCSLKLQLGCNSLDLCRYALPKRSISPQEVLHTLTHSTFDQGRISLGVLSTSDSTLVVLFFQVDFESTHEGIKRTRTLQGTGSQIFIGKFGDLMVQSTIRTPRDLEIRPINVNLGNIKIHPRSQGLKKGITFSFCSASHGGSFT